MPAFSTLMSFPIDVRPDEGLGTACLTLPIGADWLQGRVAFGGLQGAAMVRAMRAAVGDEPALRAVQVTFIGAVDPGEARAEARVVRRGRAITHAQATLHAGGRPAALAVGLFGAPRDSVVQVAMPMPALRPPGELKEVPFLPERMPGFLQHYRQRWATGSPPYSGAPPKPTGMWARLAEVTEADATGPGHRPLPPALDVPAAREANAVALADLPPSPALSVLTQRTPGASLTWLLEYIADPRRFDPRDWSMLYTETRHAAAGYTSQTARIWSEAGVPLAVSHQTTAIFD